MSRHRNVRNLNYEDFDDQYDDYGTSFEEELPLNSPTTAQYFYLRDNHSGLDQMKEEALVDSEIPKSSETSLPPVVANHRLENLNEEDRLRFWSAHEYISSVVGEAFSEDILQSAILDNHFDAEAALSFVLTKNETVCQPISPLIKTQPNKTFQPDSSSTGKKSDSVGKNRAKAKIPAEKPREGNQDREMSRFEMDMNAMGLSPMNVRIKDKVVNDSVFKTSSPRSSSSCHSPKLRTRIANVKEEFNKRKEEKQSLNLVVIGHVDAGKSTLMGHLLYQLGEVNQRLMHKYEVESKKIGKSSFAFAWVLDETEEERSRGVTVDVGTTFFETKTKRFTLLDAPGHKDFIPNMITGTSKADAAILVVNAVTGEFEVGFENGGQTREHALLARSLGVSQVVVAVNKLDMVQWSQDRYLFIQDAVRQFLKSVGFKDKNIYFIPCSGLTGVNLTKCDEPKLSAWYHQGTLLERIDQLDPPVREIDLPFRCCISDVFKGPTSGVWITGKIESGFFQVGDQICVMPNKNASEWGTVKSIEIRGRSEEWAAAGDCVDCCITGVDPTCLGVGHFLCSVDSPIPLVGKFGARIVVFDISIPITLGFPVILYTQNSNEAATICKLVSVLHKVTGEVLKRGPRCLSKNSTAIVEICLLRPLCLELYKDFRNLGRFTLRSGDKTIAAGIVTEILP